MGNASSRDDDEEEAGGENEWGDLSVHTLGVGTLLFTSKVTKPYIISERTTAFVCFCSFAEALMDAHEKIVHAYVPPTARPSSSASAPAPAPVRASHHFDPERGEETTYSNVVVDGARAVLIVKAPDFTNAYADTDTGIRNRSASPQPTEEWHFDVHDLAQQSQPPPPPLVQLSDYRIARPFGDVARSKVAVLLPTVPGYPVLDGSVAYCRINRVEMWAAFSVFMAFKKEDAGLIAAINSGDVDFTLRSGETNRTVAAQKRINAWRAGYAEDLVAFNSVVEAFSAEAGAYFTKEAVNGNNDPQIQGLVRMARAISAAEVALLTKPRDEARDY